MTASPPRCLLHLLILHSPDYKFPSQIWWAGHFQNQGKKLAHAQGLCIQNFKNIPHVTVPSASANGSVLDPLSSAQASGLSGGSSALLEPPRWLLRTCAAICNGYIAFPHRKVSEIYLHFILLSLLSSLFLFSLYCK